MTQPDWCTWWTAAEWKQFRGLAALVARMARLTATVDDERGLLVVNPGSDGEVRHSLGRAAHHARGKPPQDWPAIIRESLPLKPDHRTHAHSVRTANLDEVRPRLKATVFTDSWAAGDAAGSVVTRPLGANLVEALTVDVPEDQSSVNVSPSEVRRWGVGVDELFAIGRENLRAEPVSRAELVPGVHVLEGQVAQGMVSFAASWLLLLDEEPGAAGPFGCLVVVPNHRVLAYHPVDGPELLNHGEAVSCLLQLCRYGYDQHEQLSDRLYWWRAGRVAEIPVSNQDGQLVVELPSHLFDPTGRPPPPEHGDPELMGYVGSRLMFAGRTEEAERWLGWAADRGPAAAMCNLGALFMETGRTEEAEACFRRAIDQGYDGALANLGAWFDNAGRTEEAEAWFRRAAERGHFHGMHMLARVLARTGRAEEGEQWFRRAAEEGTSGAAMVELSDPLVVAKRYDEAEPWLRRAAEQGNPEAMFKLGLVLGWMQRNDEATEWLERAATQDYPDAVDVAERWFRANAEQGLTEFMRRLGKVLAGTDRGDEAEQWFRRAAEAGDPEAMKELALALEEAGSIADAENWYHQAIAQGNTDAMYDLGCLLKEAGRTDEAEQWYRKAADAGVVRAMTNLAALLREKGRPDEVKQWLRRAADGGSAVAMLNLGGLYVMTAATHRQAGEDTAADAALADSEQWLRKAAEAGNADAMFNLGKLTEPDRPTEARQWYRRACDAGHPDALDRLATFLD